MLFSSVPGVSRLLLLALTIAIVFYLLALLRQAGRELATTDQQFAWRVVRMAARLCLALSLVALAANVMGAVRLAILLMHTMLGSVFAAVVLYALTRVGEGVLQAALYARPFSLLVAVRRHRAQIARRINGWLKWLAFIVWLASTLQGPGLWQPFVSLLQSVWIASAHIGSISVSVRDVALFILILWAAYLASRLTRFVLEEEVFSRVRLDRGLPYALSTMVHYILMLAGIIFALTAVGVDMTKFTIVAGALTVGIGFGLQNIVNNFVSGLIVLFERPVKLGDTIQINDVVGRVEHIGIRATVVHSTAGAEVIIPNGKLISDQLTNWTLSNQLRQIAVPVVTKSDIDVENLKTILLEIAGQNASVVKMPVPEVLFNKRGIDTLEFELRVWTDNLDRWLEVRSDLTTGINEALRQNALAVDGAQHPGPA
jgi:small-conductance mechanosensitive channel